MSASRKSLLGLGLSLIRMHFQGWAVVDAYTTATANDPWPGARYLTVCAERPSSRANGSLTLSADSVGSAPAHSQSELSA